MRILFITNYFHPEPFRNNELVLELAKRGYFIKVLTSYPSYPYGEIYEGYGFDIPYEKNYNNNKNIEIDRIKSSPRGHTPIGLLMNCISFVKLGKKWVDSCDDFYDVVFYPAISPSTSGLVAKYYKDKFKKTNMIIHIQDLWPENVENILKVKFKPLINYIIKIMDAIYDASNIILCSSYSFCTYLNKVRKVDNNKLKYWPQFYIEPKDSINEKVDIEKDDSIKICYTGNIGYAQGLDILIDTAKYISDNKKDLKVKWILVGDGRAKLKLIEKVKKYNLSSQVIFIGRKSVDIANEYCKKCDMSYLSFKDSFFDMTIPAKLQGYLANKSIVLCVAGGESKEIVENNNCGFFATRNVESICEAIEKYKSLTNIEKNKMKENAYNCFKENFTANKLIGELENYFRRNYE